SGGQFWFPRERPNRTRSVFTPRMFARSRDAVSSNANARDEPGRCLLFSALCYCLAGFGISGGRSTGGGRSGASGLTTGLLPSGVGSPGGGRYVGRPVGSAAGVEPRTAFTGGSSSGIAGAA